jgi:hypothetical protein
MVQEIHKTRRNSRNITKKTSLKALVDIVDEKHDLLFIRFKEPRRLEVGEPLLTNTIVTLFTDEESGEVTAIDIVGLSGLLKELKFKS